MDVSGHASPTAIYAVVITATAVALLAVALRLYTRILIVRNIWWDDWLMTLAMIFTGGFTRCVALETHFGLGRHHDSLTQAQHSKRLLCFWLTVYLYQIGLGLCKIFIVAQCVRAFGTIRKFKFVAWSLVGIIAAYTLTTIFVTLFLCNPISHFWHPERPGHCLEQLPIWFFNTCFSILTDIAVAVLPLPVVNSLHLPKRQKYILMAIFAMGGSVCLMSIIRFYSLYAVVRNDDDTWEAPQATIYSSIEALVAIISGCLLTYTTLHSSQRKIDLYLITDGRSPMLPYMA